MTTNAAEEGVWNSPEEEIVYWKEQTMRYRQELEELRVEYDEFQENSHDLEAELEASLEQTEAKNKDLQARLQRLEDENESLRIKLDSVSAESYVTIGTLQAEKTELIRLKEAMNKYVREIEQQNDNLERGKRVTVASLDDFEMKLNTALERNAILENELDEKEQLTVTCQRLKDEVRDLRSELDVKVNRPSSEGEDDGDTNTPASVKPSSLAAQPSTVSIGTSPLTSTTSVVTPARHPPIAAPAPITPSTRISALNMVGELLRKTGVLEMRLASCKSSFSKMNTGLPPMDPSRRRPHKNGEVPTAAITKITV